MFRVFVFTVLVVASLSGNAVQYDKYGQVINPPKQNTPQQAEHNSSVAGVANVPNRKVVLNEAEFNAMMLTGLKLDQDGQRLLEVSDKIEAFIKPDQLEINAVINLEKLGNVDPVARQSVEKFDSIFPFLNGSSMNVTVYGTPIMRNGNIAIKDDFHLKVGAIPFSNGLLRQLGVDVELANTKELATSPLSISDITLRDGEIELEMLPGY